MGHDIEITTDRTKNKKVRCEKVWYLITTANTYGVSIQLLKERENSMKTNLRKILALILTTMSIATVFSIPVSAASSSPSVYYKTHCQNVGWTGNSYDGATSGTTGQALRVEAIQVRTSGMSGGISYRTHCQNVGWTDWSRDGGTSGTTGRALRVEAVQIKLTGTISQYYDVMYRTHCQNIGWTGWSKNGAISGTTGQSLRVEALQIKLVAKSGVNTISTAATSSTTWQMPMKNAYCTWKSYSNMSWATYTNNSGDRDYHLGIDIYGTNGYVNAAASGKVVAASSSTSGANGRYVVIQHTVNGKQVYSFYAHLASVNVSVGQSVSAGTKIGVAGGSGNGRNNYYGTHLHFAIVDTLWSNGRYYGYGTKFSGNKITYNGVTYYNPVYVINHNKLP